MDGRTVFVADDLLVAARMAILLPDVNLTTGAVSLRTQVSNLLPVQCLPLNLCRLDSDDETRSHVQKNFDSAEPFYLLRMKAYVRHKRTQRKKVKMERMCRRRDNRLTL